MMEDDCFDEEWDDPIAPMNRTPDPLQEAAYLEMELIGKPIGYAKKSFGYIMDATASVEFSGSTTIDVKIDSGGSTRRYYMKMPTTLVMDDRGKDNRYVLSSLRYMMVYGRTTLDRTNMYL